MTRYVFRGINVTTVQFTPYFILIAGQWGGNIENGCCGTNDAGTTYRVAHVLNTLLPDLSSTLHTHLSSNL